VGSDDTGVSSIRAKDQHPQHLLSPTYEVPPLYGIHGAFDNVGSIAAPLLAGFSVTSMGLVLQVEKDLRWPSLALNFLALASIFFIGAVQFGFWARQYVFTPSDVIQWWPDADNPLRQQMIRREQLEHWHGFKLWTRRATSGYRLGIVSLLLGLSIMLVPKTAMSVARLTAIAIVLLGLLFELLWITAQWLISTKRYPWILERLEILKPVKRVIRWMAPSVPRMNPEAIRILRP
jgi:hypothetical protein